MKIFCAITATIILASPPLSAEMSAADELVQLKEWVAKNYAQMVHATYSDSLEAAVELRAAVATLAETPSAPTLTAAQDAWVAARKPYLQSEAFRFYDGPIDAEGGPEGLLNAWPMDEAYLERIIADTSTFPEINPRLLATLNEKDGETNIASGYHAIEFLLWGADTFPDSPGRLTADAFAGSPEAIRRGKTLIAATDLLVENLESLVEAWAPDRDANYRSAFLNADPDSAIEKILTGIAVLTGFELASERLLVAYDTQLQEDEHSCFSDTTHLDAIYDLKGIANVYRGTYKSVSGSRDVRGPSIKNLAETIAPGLETEIDGALDRAITSVGAIPAPFDQAILGDDTSAGRTAIIGAIESLEDLGALLEKLVEALDFELPDSGDIAG